MSTSLQVAGLASNFDWKSFVDQIMEIEHRPADRLAVEKHTNTKKSDLLSIFGNKLTALRNAAKALDTEDLFGSRKVSSSTANSTWQLTAASDTATGTYALAVSQLATRAKLTGAADMGAGLSATDGSDVTLANMATGTAVTAGTFTVNGVQISISEAETSTMSLKDLLDRVAAATGVTATYSAATDKVTLDQGSGALMLGASNDTSNVLQVLKLGNSGGSASTSSAALGGLKLTAALGAANFRTSIAGVDGSGNGSMSINGVAIEYNVNTDTVSSLITRINSSSAGVTASYDEVNDTMVLTNTTTGDFGVAIRDTAGNLATALGLTTGSTFTAGKNARFTIDGGPTLTSTSNTLTSSSHGIVGLSVTVDSESTQSITVAADTSSMRANIDAFISSYNDVQQFIEDQTKISTVNGKVSAGVLASNREIQSWGSSLRSMAFRTISGLTGSVTRLDHLGIDFDSTSGDLKVKDSAKLDAALKDNSSDVAAFFQTATTGFADQFDTYLDNISDQNEEQQERLTAANTSLDEQIAAIERRLEQQRSVLESAFIAMETAQSKLQQQQQMLTRTFASKS